MFTNLSLPAPAREWYDEFRRHRAAVRDRVRRRQRRALLGEGLTPMEWLESRALLSTVGGTITPTVYVNAVGFSYGTALSNSQLANSTAVATVNGQTVSVPGTFTFDTGVGTVPHAGTYTYGVTFTPNDTTDYNSVDTTTQVIVSPAGTQSSADFTGSAVYGTPLPPTFVGEATSNNGLVVPGSFSFTGPYPSGWPLLNASTQYPYTLKVLFTPTDATDYSSSTSYVNIWIYPAPVTFSVISNPTTITYGTATPLSYPTTTSTILNGQTVTSTSYVLLGAGSTALPVGQYHEVVLLPPNYNKNYQYEFASGGGEITLNVTPATPTVTVNPVSIPLGTALNNTQLTGSATWTVNGQLVSVPGTFTYAAPGTILGPGNSQEEVVTFTPTDSTDYAVVTLDVLVNVSGALPVVPQAPVNLPGNRG